MKKYLYIILITACGLSACDDSPEQEFATTYPVSGEWVVNEYYDGGEISGPYHLQIFNTSFSPDSVWISNIYGSDVKAKAKVVGSNFSVEMSPDIHEEFGSVTISDGQIIGTDSIYFRVVLFDEEGEVADELVTAGRRFKGLDGK